MKNLLVILAVATVFAFSVNAQSKDCCSKEKGETTKVDKCSQDKMTMKSGDKVENTTTTALSNGKETVNKEIVVTKTKMDKKEKCGENSSCCDMKKETKIEKEVKKEIKKQ
ncbi:MAG: hypothetical protein IPJ23_03710 [Ignavibacteriales bacterium]|nr:hypothetical protein [Ignavibacteriales bacterium]